MNAVPRSITLKVPEIPVDRLPRGEIVRQLPPRTTGTNDIQYCIDDLTHVVSARTSAPLGRRNRRLDQFPLTVRHVAGVWFPFHTSLYRLERDF